MKPRPVATVGLGAILLLSGALLYARHRGSSRRAARAAAALSASTARGDAVLAVPHASGPIALDGDTDDPGWLRPPGPARTGDFLFANGAPGRPHSEAKLVWGDGYLYLSLYAADDDIESRTTEVDGPVWLDDSFRLTFADDGVECAIDVSPMAVVTDAIRRGVGAWDYSWNSGAHASKEMDGTLNDPANTDEEWIIEMAIPFESLGLKGERGENIGFSVRRCDQPRGERRVCTAWGEGPAYTIAGRIVLE
jgi:Carbohydrate family 9 binding domain-like